MEFNCLYINTPWDPGAPSRASFPKSAKTTSREKREQETLWKNGINTVKVSFSPVLMRNRWDIAQLQPLPIPPPRFSSARISFCWIPGNSCYSKCSPGTEKRNPGGIFVCKHSLAVGITFQQWISAGCGKCLAQLQFHVQFHVFLRASDYSSTS